MPGSWSNGEEKMKNNYINRLLGENELMLLVTRQHWFVLLGMILPELVVMAVMIAVSTAGSFINPLAALGFAVLIIPLGSMLRDTLIWYYQQYIVTNRRVMQVNGIVNKNVIDSSLEKVNDVKMSQSFFGRIFNYGDIEILTASELGVNLFRRIGNPVKFKIDMLNAKEKLGFSDNGLPQKQASDIPGLISKLDELRKQGVLNEEEFNIKKAALLSKM